MSLECSECERDARSGHASTCSQYRCPLCRFFGGQHEDECKWAEQEQAIQALRERNAELEKSRNTLRGRLDALLWPAHYNAEVAALLAKPEAVCPHCDELRSERDRALSELARVTETWTDDNGKVWDVPTAWAYAAACKALEQHKSELAEAKTKLIFIDADLTTAILESEEKSDYWLSRAGDIRNDINEWLDTHPLEARAAIPENGAESAPIATPAIFIEGYLEQLRQRSGAENEDLPN